LFFHRSPLTSESFIIFFSLFFSSLFFFSFFLYFLLFIFLRKKKQASKDKRRPEVAQVVRDGAFYMQTSGFITSAGGRGFNP